jgi:hypothetical protein
MILTVSSSFLGIVLNAAFTGQLISTLSNLKEIPETTVTLIDRGFKFGVPRASFLRYSVSTGVCEAKELFSNIFYPIYQIE